MNDEQTQERPRTRVWFRKRKAKLLSDQEVTAIRTTNDLSFLNMINLALDENLGEYYTKNLKDYKAVEKKLDALKKDEGHYYELRSVREWEGSSRYRRLRCSRTLYRCELNRLNSDRIELEYIKNDHASNKTLHDFATHEKIEKSGEYELVHYFLRLDRKGQAQDYTQSLISKKRKSGIHSDSYHYDASKMTLSDAKEKLEEKIKMRKSVERIKHTAREVFRKISDAC